MVDSGSLNVALNIITLLLGGGLFGVFLRYRLGLKKLASGDMADIRDHYAQEVSALRLKLNDQENHFRSVEKHWREMIEASDRRHEECERAREISRREVEGLHIEVDGLKRQIARYSAEKVLELSDRPPSPQVEAAARRVIDVIDKQENGNGAK